MSHASVIVAISREQLEEAKGSLEDAVAFQMLPFDENGEWFKHGSRWDWWQVGGRYQGKMLGKDSILRADLADDKIERQQIEHAKKLWAEYQREPKKDDFVRSYIYGLKEDDTEESVVERHKRCKISAYAFLRDRRWHEQGRLGWFGGQAKTECEIDNGHQGACTHSDEELGAKIISYNHDEDSWAENYFRRFIQNLSQDTTLVCVDYHV